MANIDGTPENNFLRGTSGDDTLLGGEGDEITAFDGITIIEVDDLLRDLPFATIKAFLSFGWSLNRTFHNIDD